MVKLKDIAYAAGVSVATVSKALAHSHEISEETTTRIMKLANEMGYIANSSARILKTNRSYNIGVVYEDKARAGLGHDYFSSMLNSIRDELGLSGYDITFISNLVGETKHSPLSHARYRRCDGVIIVVAEFENPEILELVNSDIPVVAIDHIYENRPAIMSDNHVGLYQMVKHAYRKGHRKIAFIHGEDTTVTRERIQAFIRACNELNLEIPRDYIKAAKYHLPKFSGLATRELLSLEDKPTCIIYPDDYSFMGGLSEIEKHNLSIPNDISVMGYDGIYLSRILRPKLTTYMQDAVEIGRQAASKIISVIEKRKPSTPDIITVAGKLQDGQTVKDINI